MTTSINATAGIGSVKLNADVISGVATPVEKIAFGVDGTAQTVDSTHPFPITDAAAETSLASILALMPTLSAGQVPVTDASAETALSAILAKIIAAPATAANQVTEIADLATIVTNTGAGATSANQATAQTSLSAIQLSAAASSTAANQVTELASLSTIAGNTAPITLGQKTTANSASVVGASDDPNVGPAVRIAGTPAAAINNLIIPATLCAGYAYMTFALNVAGTTCTEIFEVSNDAGPTPTNWWPLSVQRTDIPQIVAAATTVTAVCMVSAPLGFQWIRVRCSTYGSGSPNGDMSLHPRPCANVISYPQVIAPQSQSNLGPANSGRLVCAATDNLTSVHTSATVLAELTAGNTNSTTKYFLKVYNKASAPVPASDTPIAVYPLPPNSFITVNVGPFGKRLATGFAFSITGLAADTDTTAVSAIGDVCVSWNY